MSVRMERALEFLVTWTAVESDGLISTKVFRKDTHTDKYLNFSTNHPLEYNKGIVQTLMNRVGRLVSDGTELLLQTIAYESTWLEFCVDVPFAIFSTKILYPCRV